MLTIRVAAAIGCLATAVACAAQPGAPPGQAAGSPSPTEAAATDASSTTLTTPAAEPSPSGWVWDVEESDAHAHDDVAAEEGEPEGDALGEVAGEPPGEDQVDADPSAEPGWVDPCSLVTEAEWAEWTGDDTQTPVQVLEDGDACGWISADDDLRMAIGAFTALGADRWLSDDEFGDGEPVTGLGDRAVWLEDWPIEQSSTLVVEAGTFDLVIEMSARGTSGSSELLDGAVHFAELALERLP